MTLSIRRATALDPAALAAALRPEDRAEVAALGDVEAVVRHSFEASRWAYVAEEPGGLVAAWGVGNAEGDGRTLRAWCLTTALVLRHRRRFLVASRAWVEAMKHEGGEVLDGYCDARHEAAVRWLGWLGFTVHEPQMTAAGVEFRRFTMELG